LGDTPLFPHGAQALADLFLRQDDVLGWPGHGTSSGVSIRMLFWCRPKEHS
jgi:hypothetical protein